MEASSSPSGSWSLEPQNEQDPSSPGGAGRPWSHVPPFTRSAFIPACQALSPSWLGSFLHLPQTSTSGSPTPHPAGPPRLLLLPSAVSISDRTSRV